LRLAAPCAARRRPKSIDVNTSSDRAWPELPLAAWQPTCETLHLWTQVVGKVRLAKTPWLNHGWHVALYVNARGLTTSLVPFDRGQFELQFDFLEHVLDIRTTAGAIARVPLRPRTVAGFHDDVMGALHGLGITVAISDLPCEIPGAISFTRDTEHASYDPTYANRFWRVLLQADRVFKQFRTAFLGKSSPVHFFWGSFDLAVTRFSGRRAPLFTGKAPGVAPRVMQEAYSHEVSSAGFWPGGNGVDASFYSYSYPTAPAFGRARVRPDAAYWSDALGEFLLPYEAVRSAADPDATLLAFLGSTYDAAAETLGWDRAALDAPLGTPGVCRDIGSVTPS
jgi:uncharacterized protein DUF5996